MSLTDRQKSTNAALYRMAEKLGVPAAGLRLDELAAALETQVSEIIDRRCDGCPLAEVRE